MSTERRADDKPFMLHLAGMRNVDAPQWQQSNRVWRLALLRLLEATTETPVEASGR